MQLITETTLRLLNVPSSTIEIMENQGVLPLPLELAHLFDLAEIKTMAPILNKAEFDGDNLIRYETGQGESKVAHEIEHNENNIIDTFVLAHGVKLIAVHRKDGRPLREAIIDTDGVKTVRGEYMYHPEFNNSLVAVHQNPTTVDSGYVNGKDGEIFYRERLDPSKETVVQTTELDELGRTSKVRDADGLTTYTFSEDDVKGVRPLSITNHMTSGFSENETIKRVTEFEYDENGIIIFNQCYIDPNNPISKAEYRNEYEGKRLIKALRIDEGGNEGVILNNEAFWKAWDELQA